MDVQTARTLLEVGLVANGALVGVGLMLLAPRALRDRDSQAEREAAFLATFDSFTGTLDEFIAAGGLRSEPQA